MTETEPTAVRDRCRPIPSRTTPRAPSAPARRVSRRRTSPAATTRIPAAGLAEERHYGRLLLAMVVAIVASGFVIGTLIALIGPAGGR